MLTISIPDAIEGALKLPEQSKENELLRLLAVKLYEKGVLGIGKASELCGISKIEFMSLLADENVNLNYDEEELERDLQNLEYF